MLKGDSFILVCPFILVYN